MSNDKFERMCEQIDRIDERTQRLADDVSSIKRVVLEGSDVEKPLTVKVAENSAKIASVGDQIDRHEAGCIGKWKFRGVAITALAGVIVAFINTCQGG